MTSEANPHSKPLLDRLKNEEILVSDGGTGTFLQQNRIEQCGRPEEFNSSHPEIVQSMAKAYFSSGSDIVLTNSFGGSIFMQKKYGYQERVREFNTLAAEHAKRMVSNNQYVAGSIGPTGEFLEPLGDVDSETMYSAFSEQVVSLANGGADAIVIETMTALEEASIAIRAAREHSDLTVMATMTFDKGPRGYFTMMGVTPENAAKELANAGAHVVGSNCGNGIENMIEIAQIMRDATDHPLLVHSNAGIPSLKEGSILYPESPEYMASKFLELRDIGVNIIGGCCGTGPDHIVALRKALGRA